MAVAARRYWRLELGEPLYLRDRRLYAEIFRERVQQADGGGAGDAAEPLGRVAVLVAAGLLRLRERRKRHRIRPRTQHQKFTPVHWIAPAGQPGRRGQAN